MEALFDPELQHLVAALEHDLPERVLDARSARGAVDGVKIFGSTFGGGAYAGLFNRAVGGHPIRSAQTEAPKWWVEPLRARAKGAIAEL